LSPEVSGLPRTTTVGNVVERQSGGLRLVGRFGGREVGWTFAAHRDESRARAEELDERARIAVGCDAHGKGNGFQWRGEMAYSGDFAGWLEVKRSHKGWNAHLTYYALGRGYRNALSSRTGDRHGVDVRLTGSMGGSWRVGGRFASEQRFSTRVTAQEGRVWSSAPIRRNIRGSVAYSWRRADVLRPSSLSRADVGFNASVGGVSLRGRLTERWNPRRTEWRGYAAWEAWRGFQMGVGGRAEGSLGGEMLLREGYGVVGGWVSRRVKLRLLFVRRWTAEGSPPTNAIRATVDGSWG